MANASETQNHSHQSTYNPIRALERMCQLQWPHANYKITATYVGPFLCEMQLSHRPLPHCNRICKKTEQIEATYNLIKCEHQRPKGVCV